MESATPVPVPPAGSGDTRTRPRLPAMAWKVLLAGLLVREGFSFWTGSPYDLEVWIRTGNAVAQGLNPYAFWPPVPGVSIAYLTTTLPSAAYLPFWPLLTGSLYRLWEGTGGGDRFALYFLLKQPPIVGDVVTAYLLYQIAMRWTGRAPTALAALTFWSFFPYAIIMTAIWGQFDSIVVAMILAAFLVREPLARQTLYGWGIFVKWITAIYLPLEAFAVRGWRRAGVLLALAIPAAATLAVFWGLGWSFQNVIAASTSQTHGGGGGMNWVGILTSGPVNPTVESLPYVDTVLSYLWVPAILIAGWVGARWFAAGRPYGMLRAMILVTTVFLLFRWGLYEQYLLYLFPLLFLDVLAFHPARRRLFGWTSVLAYAYLLANNDLGIRFLAPLSPSVADFTDGLDASAGYGFVRTYVLIALCGLVTVTLIQLALAYYRDESAPIPWWNLLRPAPVLTAPPGS